MEFLVHDGDKLFQALETGISKLARFGSIFHTIKQLGLFFS